MMDHSLQQTINIIRYAENGEVDRMEAKRWLTFTKKNCSRVEFESKTSPGHNLFKTIKIACKLRFMSGISSQMQNLKGFTEYETVLYSAGLVIVTLHIIHKI